MKNLIYLSHSSDINYKKDFYKVLEKSKLNKDFEFICPHKYSKKQYNSKEALKNCKYVIAEISYSTIGVGIELGWADMYGVKIICIYRKGFKKSRATDVICDNFIEYENEKDMIDKLRKILL